MLIDTTNQGNGKKQIATVSAKFEKKIQEIPHGRQFFYEIDDETSGASGPAPASEALRLDSSSTNRTKTALPNHGRPAFGLYQVNKNPIYFNACL
jgi:hypothetical protein